MGAVDRCRRDRSINASFGAWPSPFPRKKKTSLETSSEGVIPLLHVLTTSKTSLENRPSVCYPRSAYNAFEKMLEAPCVLRRSGLLSLVRDNGWGTLLCTTQIGQSLHRLIRLIIVVGIPLGKIRSECQPFSPRSGKVPSRLERKPTWANRPRGCYPSTAHHFFEEMVHAQYCCVWHDGDWFPTLIWFDRVGVRYTWALGIRIWINRTQRVTYVNHFLIQTAQASGKLPSCRPASSVHQYGISGRTTNNETQNMHCMYVCVVVRSLLDCSKIRIRIYLKNEKKKIRCEIDQTWFLIKTQRIHDTWYQVYDIGPLLYE